MLPLGSRPTPRPACPFCGAVVGRPPEGFSLEGGEYHKAACSCKAVVGYDPSGVHQGALLMELLVLACGDDWDRALDLDESDYEIRHLEGYRAAEHRMAPGGSARAGSNLGAFLFVKLTAGGSP